MSGIAQILENTGRYHITERLGSGGMATVYKAEDKNLHRSVAIKVLHEHLSYEVTFQERFEREARFIAGFNHPNIVQVYDFAVAKTDKQQFYYMVMPYITGETLGDLLDVHREINEPIPRNRIHKIMRELAAALGYAHDRNMIHRDVKPGNILFDESNRTILTDFGIARLAQQSGLTGEGLIVGTPAYMSPEQATGQEVDIRSDLYALGIILFELLTGEPPYKDDGTISLLLKHVNAPVPRVSDRMHMPDENLDALVHKALAKDPDDRYQTAAEFSTDIEKAFTGRALEDKSFASFNTDSRVKNPASPDPATVILSAELHPDGEKPKNRTTTQLMQTIHTTVIKPARQNPLGLVALAIAIAALLLVARFMSPQNNSNPDFAALTTEDSSLADSMTGSFYFSTNFDDVDENNRYWEQNSSNSLIRQFTNTGEFIIRNTERGTASSTLFEPMYTYKDASITMTVTLSTGSARASAYGLIFRYQDNDNYNVFAIDSQQRYSIWVRSAGVWVELRNSDSNWEFHEAIHPAGASNEIRVDISGDTFHGIVNGVEIVSVEEATFDEGAIGVYLATSAQGEAEIAIDSYDVSELATESMTGDTVESMTGDEDTAESMTADQSE